MRNFRFLVTAGILLGTINVRADEVQTQATRAIISFSAMPIAQSSAEERIRFIKLLENYCKDVLDSIPTNTPKEDEWVDAEGRTTDTKKINRLLSSSEYGRKSMKELFSNCSERAKLIYFSKTKSERSAAAKRLEMGHLISLVSEFNSSADIEHSAQRAGLNPKAFGLDFLSTIRRTILITTMRTLEEM